MPMKRCDANLHYYDPDKHSACPHCRVPLDVPSTVGATKAAGGGGGVPSTRDVGGGSYTHGAASDPESPVTVRAAQKQLGYNPVVGWLVCTDGESRGKDYRIVAGNNTVGRDPSNDIQVAGDPLISGKEHLYISYDPDEARFYVTPNMKARNLARLNRKPLLQATELVPRDSLQIGQTVLLFVPLCGDEFRWPVGQPEVTRVVP